MTALIPRQQNSNLVFAVHSTAAVARCALCVSQEIQAPISTWTLWIQDIILALAHNYVLLFLPLVPPKGNTKSIRFASQIKKRADVHVPTNIIKLQTTMEILGKNQHKTAHLLQEKSLLSMWIYDGASMCSSSCKPYYSTSSGCRPNQIKKQIDSGQPVSDDIKKLALSSRNTIRNASPWTV